MDAIVVDDSSTDPDEVQEVSDSGEESGSRVFVSKKIPTDAEWFTQVHL